MIKEINYYFYNDIELIIKNGINGNQKENNIKVVLPIIINLIYTIITFYFEK